MFDNILNTSQYSSIELILGVWGVYLLSNGRNIEIVYPSGVKNRGCVTAPLVILEFGITYSLWFYERVFHMCSLCI